MKRNHILLNICSVAVVALLLLQYPAVAQTSDTINQLGDLESRMQKLEHKVIVPTQAGGVLFLFGAFCALWAQNTGRNPWIWFFAGVFFSGITVIVLLIKNARESPKYAR